MVEASGWKTLKQSRRQHEQRMVGEMDRTTTKKIEDKQIINWRKKKYKNRKRWKDFVGLQASKAWYTANYYFLEIKIEGFSINNF